MISNRTIQENLIRKAKHIGIIMVLIPFLLQALPTGVRCQEPICGDANSDGQVNVMDFLYIWSFVWLGGPPPDPMEVGDVRGDGGVDVGDITYFWRSAYKGEYPPFACPLNGNGESDTIEAINPGSANERYGNFFNIDLSRENQVFSEDTIFVGGEYEIRIWVENSEKLYGLSIGCYAWGGDGVVWSWNDQSEGFYFVPFFTAESDSRAEGGSVFNYSGIYPKIWSNPNPGTEIGIVAIAVLESYGMPSGPSEHMMSLHFRVDSLHDFGIHNICIDSISFGDHDDDLVYSYLDGSGVYPDALWPEGGLCWPVVIPPCGDANSDGSADVGDAVFIINYVFKGGPPPIPYCAGDANGDGEVNVGDAVYMINFVFKVGPPPAADCCS